MVLSVATNCEIDLSQWKYDQVHGDHVLAALFRMSVSSGHENLYDPSYTGGITCLSLMTKFVK